MIGNYNIIHHNIIYNDNNNMVCIYLCISVVAMVAISDVILPAACAISLLRTPLEIRASFGWKNL